LGLWSKFKIKMWFAERLSIDKQKNFAFEEWWMKPFGFFFEMNLFNWKMITILIGGLIEQMFMVLFANIKTLQIIMYMNCYFR
jgi:hypothetical protein